MVQQHVGLLEVCQTESPCALVGPTEILFCALQTPFKLLYAIVLLYRRDLGPFLLAFTQEHAVEGQGLQSPNVGFVNLAALFHGQVVLLDQRVGDVELADQNQVGQVVKHGLLVDFKFPFISHELSVPPILVHTLPCDLPRVSHSVLQLWVLDAASLESHWDQSWLSPDQLFFQFATCANPCQLNLIAFS